MFCWSCGHENLDTQKFCGECGKSLFKPEKVVREFTPRITSREVATTPSQVENVTDELSVKAPASTQSSPPPLPSLPAGTMLVPPAPSNPLIEEPRVIHQDPIGEAKAEPPVTPTPIRDRVPNRITGPSFLGLSDEPGSSRSDESSYLLEEDEETASSPWRGYLAVAVLIVFSLLAIRYWGDIRVMAAEYAQKLGISEAYKPAAGPQRVTAGNDDSQDAAKLTPDAAPEEGKNTSPVETKSKTDSAPQQTAKLEKPQSDHEAEGTKNESSAAPADKPTAEATEKTQPAAPAYDNSQLEEAQKYLQGRGVPQDCNHGLDLLRSAAKQPNPKARIQMAALYVSGHCVTEDLAQAYNWFAKAQELEPKNRLIERNLDSLWARMSDEERRKVLR